MVFKNKASTEAIIRLGYLKVAMIKMLRAEVNNGNSSADVYYNLELGVPRCKSKSNAKI